MGGKTAFLGNSLSYFRKLNEKFDLWGYRDWNNCITHFPSHCLAVEWDLFTPNFATKMTFLNLQGKSKFLADEGGMIVNLPLCFTDKKTSSISRLVKLCHELKGGGEKKHCFLWWHCITSARERNFVFSNENNYTEYLFYSHSHNNNFIFGRSAY